jgi:hypothetical protein
MKEPEKALAAGPVRATGSGLNVLAFIDQYGSVIVMVSNLNNTSTKGTLEFTNVGDGTFKCNGLLGTANNTLTITDNVGSFAVNLPARDTQVFEIQRLKWLGH